MIESNAQVNTVTESSTPSYPSPDSKFTKKSTYPLGRAYKLLETYTPENKRKIDALDHDNSMENNLSPSNSCRAKKQRLSKSAARFVDDEQVTPKTSKYIQDKWAADITNHRPIGKLGTPDKITQEIPYIFTPERGTRLDLVASYGFLRIYHQGGYLLQEQTLTDAKLFSIIEIVKKSIEGLATAPSDGYKSQTITATEEKRAEINKALKKNNNRREIDQGEAMVAHNSTLKEISAKSIMQTYLTEESIAEAAKVLQLTEEELKLLKNYQEKAEWELNHLNDHANAGTAGQISGNLVIASYACNSQMMVVERLIKAWIKSDKEVQIKAEAILIPDTHFATEIILTVTKKNGFTRTFRFNPVSLVAPTSKDYQYYYIACNELEKHHISATKSTGPNEKSSLDTSGIILDLLTAPTTSLINQPEPVSPKITARRQLFTDIDDPINPTSDEKFTFENDSLGNNSLSQTGLLAQFGLFESNFDSSDSALLDILSKEEADSRKQQNFCADGVIPSCSSHK